MDTFLTTFLDLQVNFLAFLDCFLSSFAKLLVFIRLLVMLRWLSILTELVEPRDTSFVVGIISL